MLMRLDRYHVNVGELKSRGCSWECDSNGIPMEFVLWDRMGYDGIGTIGNMTGQSAFLSESHGANPILWKMKMQTRLQILIEISGFLLTLS